MPGTCRWKTGDFGLNPEHPPMVKMLAALPILNMPLRLPALQNREFKHEAFLGGKEFLFKNDADTMLFRARMAAASLTLLLALLVFLAGQEMFGTAAGFVALILLVFDPNQLAHGAFVTTDTGLTCFLFATVYCFYRFVKKPSIGRLLLVGLAGGLALASKHTGILIFPILLAAGNLRMVPGATSQTGCKRAEATGHRAVRVVARRHHRGESSRCCGRFTASAMRRVLLDCS